jgi:hypothetical protein
MIYLCRALWHYPCLSPMAVQRKKAGDRQANITALVVEVLEAKAKATKLSGLRIEGRMMWADGWAWVGWVSGLAGLVLLAVVVLA